MLHPITIQFPNHYFSGHCELINDSPQSGLVTKFPNVNESNEDKELLLIFAEFYAFGADYFENGKLNGEDVAAKLRHQLGQIWFNNCHYEGVWPHSVNFGELCYSSDPTVDLEVTWKYKVCHVNS